MIPRGDGMHRYREMKEERGGSISDARVPGHPMRGEQCCDPGE